MATRGRPKKNPEGIVITDATETPVKRQHVPKPARTLNDLNEVRAEDMTNTEQIMYIEAERRTINVLYENMESLQKQKQEAEDKLQKIRESYAATRRFLMNVTQDAAKSVEMAMNQMEVGYGN